MTNAKKKTETNPASSAVRHAILSLSLPMIFFHIISHNQARGHRRGRLQSFWSGRIPRIKNIITNEKGYNMIDDLYIHYR